MGLVRILTKCYGILSDADVGGSNDGERKRAHDSVAPNKGKRKKK